MSFKWAYDLVLPPLTVSAKITSGQFDIFSSLQFLMFYPLSSIWNLKIFDDRVQESILEFKLVTEPSFVASMPNNGHLSETRPLLLLVDSPCEKIDLTLMRQ